MRASNPRLRRTALLAAGAWMVHGLRFALAPVDGGEGPGHGYLGVALALLAVLCLGAAVAFAVRVAWPRAEPAPRPLGRDWALCALALLALFVAQEGAESLLSAHDGIFAAGGWVAVPLCVTLGLVVALLSRGAAAAIATRLRRKPERISPAPVERAWTPRAAPALPPRTAFLRVLSPRPPPAAATPQH